jgi:hypothetical protein
MVTGLGKQKIILGFPWLNEHNPDIDWRTGKFTWRTTRRPLKIKRYHGIPAPLALAKRLARQAINATIAEEIDREERLN